MRFASPVRYRSSLPLVEMTKEIGATNVISPVDRNDIEGLK